MSPSQANNAVHADTTISKTNFNGVIQRPPLHSDDVFQQRKKLHSISHISYERRSSKIRQFLQPTRPHLHHHENAATSPTKLHHSTTTHVSREDLFQHRTNSSSKQNPFLLRDRLDRATRHNQPSNGDAETSQILNVEHCRPDSATQ